MTNTYLLPDPDNPNCPLLLPAPFGLCTEPNVPSPSPPSNMAIDDTPTKATFASNNYGLLGENTKVQPGQHVEDSLRLTCTPTPRPLQGSSHNQSQDPHVTATAQKIVMDTTLQPEPGYPNYSIYLPIPSDSESEQEGHSPYTPMIIG